MLGELVRSYRQRLGMTQEDLAAAAGISSRSIRDIETGRVASPRPGTVRMLADAFKLSGSARDRFHEATPPTGTGPASVAYGAGGEPTAGQATQPKPAQLPSDVPSFAGRAEHLRKLDALLRGRTESPTAVVITAIAGTAGIGKTALAVHWAHEVADRFPDGQLYVNLRGYGPDGTATSATQAIRGFLDALGVPSERVPVDLPAQAALYRSLLNGSRMLVVLDNARDADHVRPLLPGSRGSLAVVTSRNQLTGLIAAEGAHTLTLDVLTDAEARELLAGRLGGDRVAAEPLAVDKIINRCARLPLALSVVAARAATHPRFPLAVLADELLDDAYRLDGIDGSDPSVDVRAVFSWSYQTLSPEAARLFRQLGLHPGPDLTAPTAASLVGTSVALVRPMLAELTRTHLVTEHAPGRYTFHDLLRAYAADLARTLDPASERHAALHRLLDHYLHTGFAAAMAVRAERVPITLSPAQPGVTPESFNTADQALAWFNAEQQALVTAVHHAARHGLHTHTWQLAWAVQDFLDWRGHWHELHATQSAALNASNQVADLDARAHGHAGLARACHLLGRIAEAESHIRQAIELSRGTGNPSVEAYCHMNLSLVLRRCPDRRREALDHAQRAFRLFQQTDHQGAQAVALNCIGYLHALLGDHAHAVQYCRRALELHPQHNRAEQAHTWHSLGYAHHQAGRHRQAADCYHNAIGLYRETQRRRFEATTWTHLGDNHDAVGEPEAARHAWQQGLDILDQLDHPDAEEVRVRLQRGH